MDIPQEDAKAAPMKLVGTKTKVKIVSKDPTKKLF
jgi:hypothetical protein